MKKVACLFALIILTIPTAVRAETISVDDELSKIQEVQVTEATPKDWDRLVEFCKTAKPEPLTNGYEMCSLVEHFEEQRNNGSVYHNAIVIHCPIELLAENNAELDIFDQCIDTIVKAFEAKTGQYVCVEKNFFNNHIGLGCRYIFKSQACDYVAAQVIKIGDPGVVKVNFRNGLYYASAWKDGSGRHGHIGNRYIVEGDSVIIVKVAYLDDNNEIVEVCDKWGINIDCQRKRMLLAQKGETTLGWFYPENILVK